MSTYRCTLASTTSTSTVDGDATPTGSVDGKLRLVWSCDDVGRGPSVTIQPLQANAQCIIHSVALTVIPSSAGADDA